MSNVKDLRGKTFGTLTVIKLQTVENYKASWECKCSCGNTVVKKSSYLTTAGAKSSCGCKSKKGNPTHGESHTKLYAAWRSMKNRCREGSKYWNRGVTITQEWQTFSGFKIDMEDSFQEGLSLDRIDNSLGYTKENCRWCRPEDQSGHTARTLRFLYKDKQITLKEASKLYGVKEATIRHRLQVGWSVEDAISRLPSDPLSMMLPLS